MSYAMELQPCLYVSRLTSAAEANCQQATYIPRQLAEQAQLTKPRMLQLKPVHFCNTEPPMKCIYATQSQVNAYAESQAGALLVTALDEVAWLLNLRGGDVAHNPVFIAYAILTADNAALYVDSAKVTR